MTAAFPSLRRRVVVPALKCLGLWSQAAENLLWGTPVVESDLRALEQLGPGPALGLWQIEPDTHRDLYDNWLRFRPEWRIKLASLAAPWPSREDQLATNLIYCCAVARLIYYRDPEPLPDAEDLNGLGAYYKRVFATELGAGTVAGFVEAYERAS